MRMIVVSSAITRPEGQEHTCSQNTVAVCSPTGSKIVTSKSIKRVSLKPEGSKSDGKPIDDNSWDMDFEFEGGTGSRRDVSRISK